MVRCPKLNVYKGMIQYILESTRYSLENIAEVSKVSFSDIDSVYNQDEMPNNLEFEMALLNLYQGLLKKEASKKMSKLPYLKSYYPIQKEYTLGTGAFQEGCFPSEVMTEADIVNHSMRKLAISYFLKNTEHSLITLAEILEISIEKLLTFDCLTTEELEKLDMLRIICEELSGNPFFYELS